MVDLMLNNSVSRPEALFSSPGYFLLRIKNLDSSRPSTLAINILIKNAESISKVASCPYSTLNTSVVIFAFPAPSVIGVVCVEIGSNTRTR
jgi:hypothetical protein